MTQVKLVQDYMQKRTRHVISLEKSEELLSLLKTKFRFQELDTIFMQLDQYTELPSWIRSHFTINETFFFRHPDHFKVLGRIAKEKRKNEEKLDVLCCGVSSGEEAYSIAMLLFENMHANFKITAYDIDSQVIQKAQAGEYCEGSMMRVVSEYKHLVEKYFDTKRGPKGYSYHAKDYIKSLVQYKVGDVLNLSFNQADIVFVRNILIYFSETDKEKILTKLFEKLNPGGLLFIGGGEVFPVSLKPYLFESFHSIIQKR